MRSHSRVSDQLTAADFLIMHCHCSHSDVASVLLTLYTPLTLQDPRTAFDAAAAITSATDVDAPAFIQQAAQAAHQALLRIDPAQLDAAMPDDLALQVTTWPFRFSGHAVGSAVVKAVP